VWHTIIQLGLRIIQNFIELNYFARFVQFLEERRLGIHPNRADFRLLLLQVARHPEDSTTSAHPRVAARALDNSTARLQDTRPLGVLNYLYRHPAFYTIPRIKMLHLGQHGAFHVRRQVVNTHQGRVADGFDNAVLPHNV
jgi:hypothetical protein